MISLNLPKENNYQRRILYPTKLSFKDEEEIKTFSDNQRVIKFITNWLTLNKILRMFFKQHINDLRWKPRDKRNKKPQKW